MFVQTVRTNFETGLKYATLTHRVIPIMTNATGARQNATDRPATEGTTAQFVLPADEFAFGSVFDYDSNAHVELESTAAGCLDDHALVNVTTDECNRNVIESLLQSDSAVTDIDCIAERTDGWTYQLRWDGRAHRLMQELVAKDTTLLTAWGTNNQWKLRILTSDRHTLSERYETITNLGYDLSNLNITSYEGGDSDRFGLTDKQQEALTEAYKAGYYDIPQLITADELAEQFDISHQAISERLHRAYKQIIGDEFNMDNTRRN